jgi:hypothetical protein
MEILRTASWLSSELTFVAVFLKFRKASWFASNVARNIADRSGSVPSEPKLNA